MKTVLSFLICIFSFTFSVSAIAQTQMISGYNNVYSPFMQRIEGQLKMYFGGWKTYNQNGGRDLIYRANCQHPHQPCTGSQSVKFYDGGTFKDIPDSMQAINDPTIADMGHYLIMYFTACPRYVDCGSSTGSHSIYYSISWADDGINWSTPTLIQSNAWLPSVVRSNNNDDLLLYYNQGNNGQLRVKNLTPSGVGNGFNVAVTVNGSSNNYINIEVRNYGIGLLQILAEPLGSQSGIDYLYSTNDTTFTVGASQVITPASGLVKTRTPGMHPDTGLGFTTVPRLTQMGLPTKSTFQVGKVR